MQKLDKIAQLTDAQLVYGVLKYLGYDIFDCGDHDETSPHCWPGNGKVTELAATKNIVTIGLMGEIHLEGYGISQQIHCNGVVGGHLNQLVNRDAVSNITTDSNGQYVVSVIMGMDPEATCYVHGGDLYKAICYGFIMRHCDGTLDVPDVLVK
ncbi:hypothetical protein pEaSNUABM37_00085 [Erwinia phage pEa_SNUABM_37]|nr:hypothetical protein pEaSNUABM37_00085 [Erwinia phage pEa_SNUABM_37]QXO10555.1 hypothetical protein pEaSNUABM48_00085 [Erwinia phage pEa_SNUABM_48]